MAAECPSRLPTSACDMNPTKRRVSKASVKLKKRLCMDFTTVLSAFGSGNTNARTRHVDLCSATYVKHVCRAPVRKQPIATCDV